MLWFVAANDVAGASVVNGIRARRMWGRFFWLVRRRGNDWRDLRTNFERRCAGVDDANGVDVAAVVVVAVVGEDGVVIDGVSGVGLRDRGCCCCCCGCWRCRMCRDVGLRDRSWGRRGLRLSNGWGRFFINRQGAGHASALVLWFVAVYDVPSAAVVDGVRAFLVTVVGRCVEVENAGGVVVIAAAVGVGVGVVGASVADAVGGVDVAADGNVGVAGVEGAAGVEGVEGACGGGEAGGVDVALAVVVGVGVDVGIASAVAVAVIVVVVVETRGRRGVSKVGCGRSSMVEVEGMRYSLKGGE